MTTAAEELSVEALFRCVREQTVRLTEGMSVEDMQVQSMADASPVKWHLGHTTWFFETFILNAYKKGYSAFNANFEYLFNSYYDSVGKRHPRPQRGLVTRPSLQSLMDYREYIDTEIMALLDTQAHNSELLNLVTVGLHHEMQHQELMLTDFLHLLSRNPFFPAFRVLDAAATIFSDNTSQKCQEKPMLFTGFSETVVSVGADGEGFSYDCENPRFKTLLTPFSLSNRLVTNYEWLQFMLDGGYDNSLLWLSDGWLQRQTHDWQAPLYWYQQEGEWMQFGLNGLNPLRLQAPVCHVSYYEANAYATWAGKRLPREHELEMAMRDLPNRGNYLEEGFWQPQPAENVTGLGQLYGDVWEWTQSSYLPYPNFRAEQGALGEYNGKFMCNQMVLKGGSCVTPKAQMRPSYRNFFYPHQRWQFMGLRLAEDIE